MNIEFIGHQGLHNPSQGICDEYELSAVNGFEALLEARRRLALDHPGSMLLVSLDDRGQARYTSGHARLNLELDTPTEAELAALPPGCFEAGQYVGYTTCKDEFALCLRNLRERVTGTTFTDACGHGLTLDDAAVQEWIGFQQAPLTLLDQPLAALVVPVQDSADALVAFPNGYFTCDLSPAMNHAVVRHLQVQGYQLFGVGASYLGLLRAEPADAHVAAAVAEAFAALYNVEASNQAVFVATVMAAVGGQRHLWMRYTE